MNRHKALITAAFFFLVAGIAGVALFRAPAAHAATECGITASDIDQITAIQNDASLTNAQEIDQELALRKQLVGETITCAEQEVQTLQTNLQNASSVGSDAQPLQAQFLGDLNDAGNFYALEQAKLNGAGIAGTKAVAQEVLAWREGTFTPLSENVNNFILWAQNQNLFDTANTRMTATQRAVSFLENASPNTDLQNAFDEAQASFSAAESENAAAKAALAQDLSPDQSLSLIKQSLDSLSSTYQSFFTVGNLINGILPQ
jgi:hypothetical protein